MIGSGLRLASPDVVTHRQGVLSVMEAGGIYSTSRTLFIFVVKRFTVNQDVHRNDILEAIGPRNTLATDLDNAAGFWPIRQKVLTQARCKENLPIFISAKEYLRTFLT